MTVTAQYSIGTDTNENSSIVIIYPNPVKDVLAVNRSGLSQTATSDESITLVNNMGKVVYFTSSTDEVISIDMSHLSNGIYFIKTENGIKKIIKR